MSVITETTCATLRTVCTRRCLAVFNIIDDIILVADVVSAHGSGTLIGFDDLSSSKFKDPCSETRGSR